MKSPYLLKSFVMVLCLFLIVETSFAKPRNSEKTKLYWFIPDGMRADPDVFNVYQWAQEGKLPNIKKMMDKGAYGYSIPEFPSHTPTNFATLFTGRYPRKHGVADGPMHTEGNPLSKVSVGGFNSAAKKVSPIWVTMEKMYDKKIVLLSIPGSTPPELDKGITIRGRWAGWGADFPAVNFEDKENSSFKTSLGRSSRLFFFGPKLTQFIDSKMFQETSGMAESFSPLKEIILNQYNRAIYGHIYDSTDNGQTDYDGIVFSFDKFDIIADLKEGQWSNWIPIILNWEVDGKETPVKTSVKIKVIKLSKDGFFRIRFFYNNINKYLTKPPSIADEIVDGAGPMVDFVDNYPAQLIYYPEDKQTFLEEADMSLDWHKKAAGFLIDHYKPEIFINDTYTPNQMLTSRWWMGYVDPKSARYNDVSEEERAKLWDEVKGVYEKLDAIVGEMLKRADKNTYVILSSDHGAVPLNRFVRLNNLFAQKGWLKFTIDKETGEPVIDWEQTKVIYLKMAHIYISPTGLAGKWTRSSGPEYEKLRAEVKEVLAGLEDPETKIKPVVMIHNWEEVPEELNLPTDRVGDVVIANYPGYGWDEEMSDDKVVFGQPIISGYKQAILADQVPGMWTPFVVMGPGIKKGYHIEKPIHHIDQYPTIMKIFGKEIDLDVDGKPLDEIFK